MAWVIYFASAILNVRSRRLSFDDEATEDTMRSEAQLICLVFDCLSGHDNYVSQCGSRSPTSPYIELAFISFFHKFCKNFVSEESFGTINPLYEVWY